MSLYNLAIKHGTDKGSHGYCPHYEQMISPRLRLLEMGIGGCHSLKMWKEWLPSCEIVGFDSDASSCERARNLGFTAICGNQSNVDELAQIPGAFNIIIDDAGHDSEEQKVAFKFLWPKLLPGGWYVVEDLHQDKLQDSSPDTMESTAKSDPDVREVHHICASGGSAILFLKKR